MYAISPVLLGIQHIQDKSVHRYWVDPQLNDVQEGRAPSSLHWIVETIYRSSRGTTTAVGGRSNTSGLYEKDNRFHHRFRTHTDYSWTNFQQSKFLEIQWKYKIYYISYPYSVAFHIIRCLVLCLCYSVYPIVLHKLWIFRYLTLREANPYAKSSIGLSSVR